MILFRYNKTIYSCIFFLFWSLIMAAPLYSAQFEEETSTQEYLFTKGMIRSISIEEKTVTLKQKKAAPISFFIDENTIFEGFYRLPELKLRQKIKIWYQPKKTKNRAAKILRPLELGC